MDISYQDRVDITELIATHGHLVDAGELDRSNALFTPDATFDLSDFGQSESAGLAEVAATTRALGDAHPVGHHVTNTVLTPIGERRVRAVSKGIGVMADGSCGSVTYTDTLTRTAAGWRISRRAIRAHRRPLGGG
ncbi:MAG TPA: nuclear transport factor 2 family protein [Stackebrandtia sp.]|jgi:hypothetical protein|uniref:nuclear transport factor 2 family protein n=1 Tax=Stackebrandtia sp. TaxID=2023065 RepID=UPI002D34AC3C|nr:nuclear transport factor 2 family protein [Stackebrandtia sp.]HZE39541.1 nuclear transport factor 2 family protein [Stackebrandtia sp.]